MTKKHFEEIARQIERTLRGPAHPSLPVAEGTVRYRPIVKLAFRLADSFEHFNPYFDRERFLTACGIDEAREAYRAAEAVLDAEARARYIDNQRARKVSK